MNDDDDDVSNDEVPDSDYLDIVDEFDNTPEGEYRNSINEENLSDSDFDYQQGFEEKNYPQSPMKDSITKFYRDVISLMLPKKVVRVGNFKPKELKNARRFLNIADYNLMEGCPLISKYFNNKAVVESATSMGRNGFLLTNIMTQRRIVQRQSDKAQGGKNYMGQQQQKGGK